MSPTNGSPQKDRSKYLVPGRWKYLEADFDQVEQRSSGMTAQIARRQEDDWRRREPTPNQRVVVRLMAVKVENDAQ